MMTFSKARQCVLAYGACALWLIISGDSLATDIPRIVRQTKPAIVHIMTDDGHGVIKTGTGFFVDERGDVLTNFHVIAVPVEHANDARIYCRTASGERLELKRIYCWSFDPDLVVLTFKTQTATPYLALGDSAAVQEGQRVLVIGDPEGLYGTVSDGMVSAIREKGDLIQMTAPISPGSSGSPVLDETGKVIGVAQKSLIEGQNINFAVSIAAFHSMIERVFKNYALSVDEDPAPQSDVRSANLIMEGAYNDLLSLLKPEDKALLELDQHIWLQKRRGVKTNSDRFTEMTFQRGWALHDLCEKYSQ